MTAASQYAAAMAQLTAARTGQMLDSGTAVRPAELGQTPVLDDDGNPVVPEGEPVYSGPCTISDPTMAQRGDRTSDDQSGVPDERLLKVPHTADLRPGDLFTVNTAAFSPGIVGDVFLVVGELEKSYATSRRYRIRGSSWRSPPAGP